MTGSYSPSEATLRKMVEKTLFKERLREESAKRPKPKFEIGQSVGVPAVVADTEFAKIVGRMWGPDEREGCSEGWLYLLVFSIGEIDDKTVWSSKRFGATEAELISWQS